MSERKGLLIVLSAEDIIGYPKRDKWSGVHTHWIIIIYNIVGIFYLCF